MNAEFIDLTEVDLTNDQDQSNESILILKSSIRNQLTKHLKSLSQSLKFGLPISNKDADQIDELIDIFDNLPTKSNDRNLIEFNNQINLKEISKTINQNFNSKSSTNEEPTYSKTRQMQQHLVLLLHAYKCAKKGKICNLSNCETMKNVLNHMVICKNNLYCEVKHCISSKQIITHWKYCKKTCRLCSPLRDIESSKIKS